MSRRRRRGRRSCGRSIARSPGCRTAWPASRGSPGWSAGARRTPVKLSVSAPSRCSLPVADGTSETDWVETSTWPWLERARCISATARAPARPWSTEPNSSSSSTHWASSGSVRAAAPTSASASVVIVSASSLMSSTCVFHSTTAPAAIAAGSVTAPRSLGREHAPPRLAGDDLERAQAAVELALRDALAAAPAAWSARRSSRSRSALAAAASAASRREARALRDAQQRRQRDRPAPGGRRAPRRRGRDGRAARASSGWRLSRSSPRPARRAARRRRPGSSAQIGFHRSVAAS